MEDPGSINNKMFSKISKSLGSVKIKKEINNCAEKLLENVISNECENKLKLNKIAILGVFEKISQNNLAKNYHIENRIFNKEDVEDDDDNDDEDNNGLSNLEKGISSDFILHILQKLSEKRNNNIISKRLKNLVK